MPTSTHADDVGDRDLLSAATEGDRGAFGAIYDRHVRAVYWQAYAVLRDANEAEEVTQETFVTMWRRVREISVVDDSALPWLLRTAKYTALNAHRRLQRELGRSTEFDDELGAPTPSPEQEFLAAQVSAEIDKAVGDLSERDRTLYELCVAGDHTYDDAAAQLGVTHAAVRNRLSRVRARLRADLRTVREPS